jgi:Bacterial SH3 domain
MRQLVSIWVLAALSALASALWPGAAAAQSDALKLQVTDPYLELHTGPGRGYPVFHVAQRGEAVEVLLRHTDWFKVRTANGREGWVPRLQIENTLAQIGPTQQPTRSLLAADDARRRFEVGAARGRFDGEPSLKIWTRAKLADTVGVEAVLGQVQGLYSGTDYYSLNLQLEPWSDRAIAPHFGIGFGRFNNLPNLSLVGALPTDAKLASATLGLRWTFARRFVARADYTLTTAYIDDSKSGEYRALHLGLAFTF